ncbi:hypothetical protein EVAR_99767_1 [Eumeta japonica]|uniref:Uncharacterized protein n=1 Tax=Eumeta variegata TaxID=151549 RepID=A0A4C1SBF2_EUMVA|nr:hypothetical protein EVAR_99767_1 [Eumeta japonica]
MLGVTCNVIECHRVRPETCTTSRPRTDESTAPQPKAVHDLSPGRQNTWWSRHALRHPIRDPLKNLSSLFPKDQRVQTLSPPRRSGVDRSLLTTIITNTLTTASNDEELMCS